MENKARGGSTLKRPVPGKVTPKVGGERRHSVGIEELERMLSVETGMDPLEAASISMGESSMYDNSLITGFSEKEQNEWNVNKDDEDSANIPTWNTGARERGGYDSNSAMVDESRIGAGVENSKLNKVSRGRSLTRKELDSSESVAPIPGMFNKGKGKSVTNSEMRSRDSVRDEEPPKKAFKVDIKRNPVNEESEEVHNEPKVGIMDIPVSAGGSEFGDSQTEEMDDEYYAKWAASEAAKMKNLAGQGEFQPMVMSGEASTVDIDDIYGGSTPEEMKEELRIDSGEEEDEVPAKKGRLFSKKGAKKEKAPKDKKPKKEKPEKEKKAKAEKPKKEKPEKVKKPKKQKSRGNTNVEVDAGSTRFVKEEEDYIYTDLYKFDMKIPILGIILVGLLLGIGVMMFKDDSSKENEEALRQQAETIAQLQQQLTEMQNQQNGEDEEVDEELDEEYEEEVAPETPNSEYAESGSGDTITPISFSDLELYMDDVVETQLVAQSGIAGMQIGRVTVFTPSDTVIFNVTNTDSIVSVTGNDTGAGASMDVQPVECDSLVGAVERYLQDNVMGYVSEYQRVNSEVDERRCYINSTYNIDGVIWDHHVGMLAIDDGACLMVTMSIPETADGMTKELLNNAFIANMSDRFLKGE